MTGSSEGRKSSTTSKPERVEAPLTPDEKDALAVVLDSCLGMPVESWTELKRMCLDLFKEMEEAVPRLRTPRTRDGSLRGEEVIDQWTDPDEDPQLVFGSILAVLYERIDHGQSVFTSMKYFNSAVESRVTP
jgi:hypothetical protein